MKRFTVRGNGVSYSYVFICSTSISWKFAVCQVIGNSSEQRRMVPPPVKPEPHREDQIWSGQAAQSDKRELRSHTLLLVFTLRRVKKKKSEVKLNNTFCSTEPVVYCWTLRTWRLVYTYSRCENWPQAGSALVTRGSQWPGWAEQAQSWGCLSWGGGGGSMRRGVSCQWLCRGEGALLGDSSHQFGSAAGGSLV